MPLPPGPRPLVTTAALVGIFGCSLALAWAVTRSRLPAELGPLSAPRAFGDLKVRIPKAYRVVENTGRAGGAAGGEELGTPLMVASDPQPVTVVRSAQGETDVVEGGRKLSAYMVTPEVMMPPSQVMADYFRVDKAETMEVAGYPGLWAGLGYQLKGEGAKGKAEPRMRFKLIAATTLPSGRVVLLTLGGPGQLVHADVELLQRVAKSMSVEGEGAAVSAGGDAFDVLRYRSVLSPVTLALSGDFAAGQARPTTRRGAVESGAIGIIYADTEGQVATVEVIPVYLPPQGAQEGRGASGKAELEDTQAGRKEEAGTEDELTAAFLARAYAASHDRLLTSVTAKQVARGRLLLTPSRRESTVVRAMAVSSEESPLGALIVVRAPVAMESVVNRLLNRAADRLTFDRRSDDLEALASAGRSLSAQALSVAPFSGALIFREMGTGTVCGWTTYTDSTIKSRREGDALHPVSGALRKASVSGGIATVSLTQSVSLEGIEQEVWSASALVPVASGRVPEVAGNATQNLDAFESLKYAKTYVPAPRLFPTLGAGSAEPALVVTDHLPGVDTLRLGPPSFWVVLSVPLASSGGTRTVLLRPLGSPYTLLARYKVDAGVGETEGGGRLVSLDVSPLLQAVPLPPDHPLPALDGESGEDVKGSAKPE